jgi:hypothetical protein
MEKLVDFFSELMEELANWTPGKEFPEIPIEDVPDEIQRHLKETNFQVINTFDIESKDFSFIMKHF